MSINEIYFIYCFLRYKNMIDMISCFMNTQRIFSGYSMLANFTLIKDWSHMFWFYMSLNACSVRWTIVTIWTLPLVALFGINTFNSYHFGSDQVTKVWKVQRSEHQKLLFMLSKSVYSKGISSWAFVTT